MLSVNLLLGCFEGIPTSNHISAEHLPFKYVSILPESSSDMQMDTLYISPLSAALTRNMSNPGFCYVGVRDRMPDSLETNTNLEGILVANQNISVNQVFTLVQNSFREIGNWISSLQQACINQCSFQKLLDLSEHITPNSIYVLNDSYSLLAHTKNNSDDAPCNRYLIQNGYHSREFIDMLRDTHRIETYRTRYGVLCGTPTEIQPYHSISQWLTFHGVKLIQVVMICSKEQQTPKQIELFKILVSFCDVTLRRQQESDRTLLPAYQNIISDILFNGLSDHNIIAERAAVGSISARGCFDIFCVKFVEGMNVPVGRVAKEMSDILVNSHVITHGFEIIALNTYYCGEYVKPCSEAERARDVLAQTIRDTLSSYSAYCGVSEFFYDFTEMKSAYTEAVRAASIGQKLCGLNDFWGFKVSNIPDKAPFYFFDDIYPHYMVIASRQASIDILRSASGTVKIEELYAYDTEHGSNNLNVLYAYLISERRTSVAGEMLHMHRNNVLYRIQRIESMLDVDLNNLSAREKCLIGIRCLESRLFGV